jgi:hydroxycarboxylate dehydrogenase B
LPRYVDAVLEGGLTPNASARVVLDIGTLLTLDGQRGYGQVVGEQAMQMALQRAKAHGSCIMALGNAHHLGRIGHFAEMAVAEGLVSLHFVNVLSRPVVAPWGGADGRFGTNPCCIGVPLGTASQRREPFILDFATSRVAQGKMRVAYNEGRQVEPGYLIDEQGRPTTNPGVVVVPQGANPAHGLFGALMPFGEHKGYGMAVACELLGGALSGGGTWHRPADTARAVVNGMLTIVIDPAKLGTQASFEQEAAAFVDWLQQAPAAPDSDRVRIAGEPEREARAQRERDGIVIDDTTWAEIEAAAEKARPPA